MASPLGRLGLRVRGDALAALDWTDAPMQAPADALAGEAMRQLEAWFAGRLRGFDLPLAPAPTAFQTRVRAALLAIPFGETVTYAELAARIGSNPRAVGGGCRANPLPIVVPCHRVLAAHGFGGYAGAIAGPLLDAKRWLLEHEKGVSGVTQAKQPPGFPGRFTAPGTGDLFAQA